MTAAARPARHGGGFRMLALLALAGCGAWAMAACDKVPLLAPTQSTITLFATSSVLQLNGTTEITATVIEQAGTPVQNGTTVTFTASLGSVSPAEARTTNGRVTVQFNAGSRSGIAEIRASSGAAKLGTDPFKITIGAAGVAGIRMSASPARLPSSGGSSLITAVATDAGGNVLTGVPVSFSTDYGTLSSSGATTSSAGEASVTLTTSRDAKVTATAGTVTNGTAAATGTLTVALNVLPTLSFGAVSPSSPVEEQVITFPLTITSTGATSLFQSVVVSFGDGTTQSLGPLNSSTSVFHAYDSDGGYLVTATGTDATGDRQTATVAIVVKSMTPISVNIAITNSTLPIQKNTVANFAANITGSTTSPIDHYQWTFGDGKSLFTNGNTASHIYEDAKSYTVTVVVVGTDGNSGTGQTIITITP
jgi:hypothetical protein